VEDSFKVLESRIHRAAERLKQLAAEGESLRAELQEARARASAAEQKLEQAAGDGEGQAEQARKAQGLAVEIKSLKREREEIRTRIERLVELLDTLE
jgi:predicted RNase H-like nuclease (RuvC/YqgF family)